MPGGGVRIGSGPLTFAPHSASVPLPRAKKSAPRARMRPALLLRE